MAIGARCCHLAQGRVVALVSDSDTQGLQCCRYFVIHRISAHSYVGQRLARLELRMMIMMLIISFEFRPIPKEYASFRANEVINRGPEITYIRPILRT